MDSKIARYGDYLCRICSAFALFFYRAERRGGKLTVEKVCELFDVDEKFLAGANRDDFSGIDFLSNKVWGVDGISLPFR